MIVKQFVTSNRESEITIGKLNVGVGRGANYED